MHGMHGIPIPLHTGTKYPAITEPLGPHLQLTVAYWPPPLRDMGSMRN